MNPRELITAIWAGQQVDRFPMNGIWPWGETMERWRREGMPEGMHPASYLDILSDRGCGLPLNLNMVPPFPIRVLQMGDDYVTLVPGLVHTIVDDLVTFWLETFAKLLDGAVRLDQTMFFEDMCATKAPMISPAGFREFMAPGYRTFIGGMREMGVKEFWVDTSRS